MYSSKASLARHQQQFVDWIFRPEASATNSDDPSNDGKAIYQNNLLFTASRALQITYPVLTRLLGKDAIGQLARHILRRSPPATGNWSDWGQPMDEVISTTPLAVSYPFLPDIARLEWALHQSGRCAVRPIELQTLAGLEGQHLLQARIQLSPCVQILESRYPIHHIWQAHQTRDQNGKVDEVGLVRAIARYQGPCRLVIYQKNQLSQMLSVSAVEFQWLCDVQSQATVAALLDNHPQLDFIRWLTKAIDLNWIANLVIQE